MSGPGLFLRVCQGSGSRTGVIATVKFEVDAGTKIFALAVVAASVLPLDSFVRCTGENSAAVCAAPLPPPFKL